MTFEFYSLQPGEGITGKQPIRRGVSSDNVQTYLDVLADEHLGYRNWQAITVYQRFQDYNSGHQIVAVEEWR